MTKPDGQLLVCERWTIPGSWQFPQGGIDEGETEEEALFREVDEEIGLKAEHYEILSQRSGYRYLYPETVRRKKARKHGCAGQEQVYFLCRLRADAPEVNVNQQPREFANYRWIRPEEFEIGWLPAFKRDVYVEVMKDFFGIELSLSRSQGA